MKNKKLVFNDKVDTGKQKLKNILGGRGRNELCDIAMEHNIMNFAMTVLCNHKLKVILL